MGTQVRQGRGQEERDPSVREVEPQSLFAEGGLLSNAGQEAHAARARASRADGHQEGLPRLEAERVVAIGDVHGDALALIEALSRAGVINTTREAVEAALAAGRDPFPDIHWVAQPGTMVVTLGDYIDRGRQDGRVLELLERLVAESRGQLVPLVGNHELMNATGEFQDVNSAGDYRGRERARDFAPGGRWANWFAENAYAAVVVNDTIYVHGGVRDVFAAHLGQLNEETRDYLGGTRQSQPNVDGDHHSDFSADDENSPFWDRDMARERASDSELSRVLAELGVSRMVVGHTPMGLGDIVSQYGGRVWAVDVAMSNAYDRDAQAIIRERARSLPREQRQAWIEEQLAVSRVRVLEIVAGRDPNEL